MHRTVFARVFLLAFAVVLFAVHAADAQGWRGAGRAKGMVEDPSGAPVVGAKVSVIWGENEGGGPPAVTTDAKGRWTLVGLTGGNWKLEIEATNYLPFQDDFVVYAAGVPDTLRVILVPIPKEELEAAAAAAKLSGINSALQEGNRLAGEGKYEAARKSYETALTQVEGAKQADILVGIASTYVQEKNNAEGEKYLAKALTADPKNETALRLMVSVLAAQGKDEEAKQYLARLPDEASLDQSTQLNLGIMKYNEGKLDEASAIFERVLTQSPDRAEAYYFAGLVHLNQQHNDLALERFKKFLELAPEDKRAGEAREFVTHLEKAAAAAKP